MILAEHGTIGMSFGAGDYAHDIRLACHGLDKDDNDFVVGLIGKDLYPLSAIVQTMRKTQQTSLYLERLGPFFVGPGALAERRIVKANAQSTHEFDKLTMSAHPEPVEAMSSVRLILREIRGRREGRRLSVLRRLFVGVGRA